MEKDDTDSVTESGESETESRVFSSDLDAMGSPRTLDAQSAIPTIDSAGIL